MEYPFAVSLLVLFVSVILIAQTAITIYNYNKNKQARDLNFYWSWLVLIVAVITALFGMIGMFMHRASAASYVAPAPQTVAAPPQVPAPA